MDEIRFEIEHLKQGQKRHEERISLLEKSDAKDNERFARMETEFKNSNQMLQEIRQDVKSIKSKKNDGYRQWAWIVITGVTSGVVGFLINSLIK